MVVLVSTTGSDQNAVSRDVQIQMVVRGEFPFTPRAAHHQSTQQGQEMHHLTKLASDRFWAVDQDRTRLKFVMIERFQKATAAAAVAVTSE